MHARSAMQQLPNPSAIKLIPHNAFFPLRIIRHHVVPNSLKATRVLRAHTLFTQRSHTLSLTLYLTRIESSK